MLMETYNVIQFIRLLLGYLGFTVGLPALVFYPKTKRYSASVRFLISFTIGNFYIINLVQLLQLLHISNRFTLILFTFVPAFLLSVRFYRLPVVSFVKNLLTECKRYFMQEIGFKSFLRHRLRECKDFFIIIGKNTLRLLRENAIDFPFFLCFVWLIWKVCGPGILNNWAYGASDIPVHNYWINGLLDNNIFIAGIYPMGMHCMLYYLAVLMDIPVFETLRLFWLVQYSVIALMILAFLKGVCKNRFFPYLGCLLFVGTKFFASSSYLRYGATLPQEFGMLYILPSAFFAMDFFRVRTDELSHGVNRIRCSSTYLLLGFAMSFSLTITSHFYDTIIAGILCIGIAIGYGYWFWRKEYCLRVLLAGVLSVLMAFLPMAIALLFGKSLQGSMYWAMSIIGLRDYTVLIFRIICFLVVAATVGCVVWVIYGIKKGRISFENQPIPSHTKRGLFLLQLSTLIPFVAVLLIGFLYRNNILSASKNISFSIPDMRWVLYGIGAAAVFGLLAWFHVDPMCGAGLLSMISSQIFLGIVLISGAVGLPMLMEPARICMYFSYLIPVLFVMTIDGIVNCLCAARYHDVQQTIGVVLTVFLIGAGITGNWIRQPFGGGRLEMNEAIFCTTNILRDNRGENFKWTIVSANDEYRMIESYGRHTETIEFLEDMEYWNPNKEVTIPTDRVYFYIEKQPLDYADGYGKAVPVVSEEQAHNPLPKNSGLNPYGKTNRSVTMSRMYYWAQEFLSLYPNEMKVYYENDRFVCYYIEQNVYRLYNFAIDYGYNTNDWSTETEVE